MPLQADPPSILLLPSILQPASANILISPDYEAPFTAKIACLIGLGQPPTVGVSGDIVTVFVPAQVISLNVGCTVTVRSPSTNESVQVPVTIQATVLSRQKRSAPALPTLLGFRPATLSLDGNAFGASGTVAVVGSGAPYRATVGCPAGVNLAATALGDSVRVTALGKAQQSVDCMLTVVTRTGFSAQVPVHVSAALGGPAASGATSPASAGGAHLDRTNLTLRVGERQSTQIVGRGPFQVSGCDRIATVRLDGNAVDVAAKRTARAP